MMLSFVEAEKTGCGEHHRDLCGQLPFLTYIPLRQSFSSGKICHLLHPCHHLVKVVGAVALVGLLEPEITGGWI